MDHTGIETTVESSSSRHAVRLVGYVDAGNSHVVRDCLTACEPDRALEIDVGGLTFIDSSGIGVFVGQWKRWEDAGEPILLVEVPPAVQRVLDVTGLSAMYEPPAGS